MPDPTKTPARRPGPGDLVSIKNDLGFGANVGDVGRIRAGDKADPCPYCDDDDCREWPNVDLLDGRTVYHVPECAMETINDPTKTANLPPFVIRGEGLLWPANDGTNRLVEHPYGVDAYCVQGLDGKVRTFANQDAAKSWLTTPEGKAACLPQEGVMRGRREVP